MTFGGPNSGSGGPSGGAPGGFGAPGAAQPGSPAATPASVAWRDGSWDRIRIDGQQVIGRVAELTVTPERDVSLVAGPNKDGPATQDKGYKGASISWTQEVWRASMAEQLVAFLATLSPRQPGAVSSWHTIEHPICAAAGVTRIYVSSYSVSMPSAGLWQVQITASEWFPSAKKTGPLMPPGDHGGDLGDPGVPPPDPANLGADFP